MIWIAATFTLLMVITMIINSTSRAKEIANPQGASPRSLTERDKAYVVEYYKRFGGKEFSLASIEGKKLSWGVASKYDVPSKRLDDRTVLGRRLIDHGLLHSSEIGRYQLTDAGVKLAIREAE